MNKPYSDVALSERAQSEESILKKWQDSNILDQVDKKPSPQGEFVFYEGPPGANGRPGFHHIESRSYKDVIPRYKRMCGFHIYMKAGWDTHGLPIEMQAEKQLGLTSKKQIEQYGIAEFNQKCREVIWTYQSEWEASTMRMGFWLDLKKPYITCDNSYIESCWNVIATANKKDLLYRDFKVLPWCPRCETPLSSHELAQPGAYKDVRELSVYVNFKITSGELANAYIVAWTTTPWTLPGNIALAVGSNISYTVCAVDNVHYIVATELVHQVMEKMQYTVVREITGSDLVGSRYEPVFDWLQHNLNSDELGKLKQAYTIYAADFVTTSDGTGVVHIAPMYGQDDFELGTKHNLPKQHCVNDDGTFAEYCDFLAHRSVKELSPDGTETVAVDIIRNLATRGLLFKKTKYEHSYPHCWRCDTPLLYFARNSWYIRMTQLRDAMVAGNNHINWIPSDVQTGRFGEWIGNVRDWAISRDRYWGTPIPVWETPDDKERIVVSSFADFKKYSKTSGNTYITMRHGHCESNLGGVWSIDPLCKNTLTETGRTQVANAANQLASIGITKIICSPFVRTTETAHIIAQSLGIAESDIIYDARIGELQAGSQFDGKFYTEVSGRYDAIENPYVYRFEQGESLQDLCTRTGEFLYDCEQKYKNENILIVSHMSAIVAMKYHEHSDSEVRSFYDWYYHHDISATQHNTHIPNAEPIPLQFIPMPHNEHYELDVHKPYIDSVELISPSGIRMQRTGEVMDVWFDSGCMPFAQYHYPFSVGDDFLKTQFPANYICEALDQTRGWFYTLHAVANIMGYEKSFEQAICLGLILDKEGKKMSKSKGNVVVPWDMFNQYGSDVVRMWMYTINQPGDNKNFEPKLLSEINSKFFRTLENCIAFYEQSRKELVIDPKSDSDHSMDIWLITLLHKTHTQVTSELDQFHIFESARLLRDFVTELSQWYIRRSRIRMRELSDPDAMQALSTLRYVFEMVSKMIAPFTPFFAEEIYTQIASDKSSVHMTNWPEVMPFDQNILDEMDQVRNIVSVALEKRSSAKIRVRQPLSYIYIPESLSMSTSLQDIILDELNIKQIIRKGSEIEIDTNITPELYAEGDTREIIRSVQEMRKVQGLIPSEKVLLTLSEFPENCEPYRSEICRISGVENILIASAGDTGIASLVEMHTGVQIALSITKI